MKKTIFVLGILIFSLLSTINVNSFPNKQNTNFYQSFVNEEWNTTFGGTNIDEGYSVEQTSDGGYIITGYTRSYGAAGHNVWLIKTDSYGNEQWNKTFGGSEDDEGQSVQQTSDGGYIIAGWTKSYGAVNKDLWLIKTGSSGNEQWNKIFGGTTDDAGTSVRQTSDGGFIIAGYTSSSGAGSVDAWLIKTDSSGNQQWSKTLGGSSTDGAYSLQKTTDGGYILAGWTMSYGPGPLLNVWLVKTDGQGNQQWNKAFGGTGSDKAYSVEQTTDGGYIIAGETDSYGAGNIDAWLIKTDSSGNEQWNKTFGGSIRDYGYSVQQTFGGGYIMVGYTNSFTSSDDIYLIKTDSSGNKVWDKLLGGIYSEEGKSVQQTTDGGYIITGFTLSYGAGVHDVWLIKMVSDETPPLVVDAGGPYEGFIGQPVEFKGNVTGGVPPYNYLWDFGDGNTSTQENPNHVYIIANNYTVSLTVTDDSGNYSTDYTWANIIDSNNPPNIPEITGPTKGKIKVELKFNISTTDPDLDDVFYFIDWGDQTNSSWVGPYVSGVNISINHSWNEKGTFTIKVKAKDIKGSESNWKTLEVNIPRNRFIEKTFILRVIDRFLKVFSSIKLFL